MSFLGTNQLETAPLIFPTEALGAGDLGSSARFVEWYGRDLNVRDACGLFTANEYVEAPLDGEDESAPKQGDSPRKAADVVR